MPITFIDDDAKTLYDNLISRMERELGEILNPGDERRIVAGNIAMVLAQLRSSINAAANAQLVNYSYGKFLDELGALLQVSRLPAQKASVTLKFQLTAPTGTAILIPAGTRATPDGSLFFETLEDILVPYDTPAAEAKAAATHAGSVYNGYSPGFIKTIVDPSPYVLSVTNTDTSSGGADEEDDESFRERIRLAPEGFSTAGPRGAYIYWAKTADASIGDVSVIQPSPGSVKVTVLGKDGTLPNQEVLDKVTAVLSDTLRRPLTDQVTVSAPETVSYNIELTYYISQADASIAGEIRQAVTQAVEEYKLWQSSKLGLAINPDELRRRVLNAGASRIVVTAPEYMTVPATEAAQAGSVSVAYGGSSA